MKGFYTSMTAHDGVSYFYYKNTITAPEKDKARLNGGYVSGIGIQTKDDLTELFFHAKVGISMQIGSSLPYAIDQIEKNFASVEA